MTINNHDNQGAQVTRQQNKEIEKNQTKNGSHK